MKIAVFDKYRVGLVQGEEIVDVTGALPSFLDELPAQRMNWLIANWEGMAGPLQAYGRSAPALALSNVTLLPPSPAPSHVFAAPANYSKHIGELGSRTVTKAGRSAREQGFFLKAPGSLMGAGGCIRLPAGSSRRFDHESELAVVIGRHARNVSRDEAMNYVFGYSCLIDATMRIEQGVAEEERSMRKSFETFTPMGPYLITADEIAEPGSLKNRLWVNDELRQEANTSEMIVGIAELIEMISSVLPLQPGDVIATGTPQGVGPFMAGDRVKIAIEKVGEMTLDVSECEQRSPRPY